MINNLREELKKIYSRQSSFYLNNFIEKNIIGLLILKYYCDNSIFEYKNIIKNEKIEDVKFPIDSFEYKIPSIEHTKLLSLIQYENLEDLIKEYIGSTIGINIIENNLKKVCITTSLEKSVYDLSGNTTYVIDKFKILRYEIATFQFFDKVLKNNNQYMKYEETFNEENNKYDYVYMYDNIPKYRFIKDSENDIYALIYLILRKNNKQKIILQSDYKKISNLKNTRLIIKNMTKVLLLDDNKVFIYYEPKKDDKVTIINYDQNKIKSRDKLLEIIKLNRKQKDILVKTTTEEIISNHYRIGFRLYQTGMEEDIRNINEIVDENTRLIEKLSSINKIIEEEINNLINR